MKALNKMTKSELIQLIGSKDIELAVLRSKVSEQPVRRTIDSECQRMVAERQEAMREAREMAMASGRTVKV